MAAWLELAVLCKAATYRDGLLCVLDAGITTVTPSALPAIADLTVTAQFAFTEPNVGNKHLLGIQVQSERGTSLSSMTVPVTPERPPDADLELPFLFTWIQPLAVEFASAGMHIIDFSVDGSTVKELPFRVRL